MAASFKNRVCFIKEYQRANPCNHWSELAFQSVPNASRGTLRKRRNPCKHWLGTLVRFRHVLAGGEAEERLKAEG